ncbi:LysM peptidoglycan-binding domain-containing protein [Vagococcus fluvialis]|uniref:muramidase family protein n=1 Tax=Vagococcus fluvialis TaxID=2738 RepID=UPI001A8C24F6|nr:LysM peptidoglycan-binding domain-containing protein [Vagococcus fluvialis]MBO0444339.1 LysM peptidoglycan-binding domain-containing protein [Vagococcus fluvialis]
MSTKKVKLGIKLSVLSLLLATTLPSGLVYAESKEYTELSISDHTELSENSLNSLELKKELEIPLVSNETIQSAETSETTDETINQETLNEYTQELPSETATVSSTIDVIHSDEENVYSIPQEAPSPIRRKLGQLEARSTSTPKDEEALTEEVFDEKAFDQAIEQYLDNANEEELELLLNASTEQEMKAALEYLLFNQIEEEYGVEELAELKKYLSAEEIERLDNEADHAKFKSYLTDLFNKREKQMDVESVIDEIILLSTEEEFTRIQQATEDELTDVLLEIADSKVAPLENENKKREKRAIPIVLAPWLVANATPILIGAGKTVIAAGAGIYVGVKARNAKIQSNARRYQRNQEIARAANAQARRVQAVARTAKRVSQMAQNYAANQARAQAVARVRAQTASLKQQADARARAQTAANARRQSTARPYITTKPVVKPIIKPRPAVVKPAPTTKSTVNNKDTVHVVKSGDSLWVISNRTGISIEMLRKLNNIKGDVIQPGQRLIVKKAAVPTPTVVNKDTIHTVKSGDSLWAISNRTGVSIEMLRKLNNIKGDVIQPGKRLIVKKAVIPAPAVVNKDTIHTVKSGDSLWAISNRTGVSVEVLRKLNNIKGDVIQPGQRLIVKKAITSNTNNTHTVKYGDTLWTISMINGISIDTLRQLNHIKGDLIQPGQQLIVKSSGTSSTVKPATPNKDVTHKTTYGDSLWVIASKYGVTIDSLRKQNNIKGDLIHPGQILLVTKGSTSAPAIKQPVGTKTEQYIVKPGNSLWQIANNYGISIPDLVKWNSIKNYTIHPGQTIAIHKIVAIPEKPVITTIPKREESSGVTKTPDAPKHPIITTVPKVEPKPVVTTTPNVDDQSGITTIPKVDTKPTIEKSSELKTNYKYSHSVIEKAKLDPLYHDFPKSMDIDILSNPVVTREDGRIEHLIKGNINDESGIYHITVKGDSIIHRTFIPESDWARFSKVNGLPELIKIPSLK